jgi:hypothetical protein
MNELAGAARFGWAGHPNAPLRGRMLDPRHFEFRGGAARPLSSLNRDMDIKPTRVVSWWATGVSVGGPARQACLRHEHAARYPLIPPGLWLPAKSIAELAGGRPSEPGHRRVGRRTLDPAHFDFRGGGDVPRATPTRAGDPNGSWSGE